MRVAACFLVQNADEYVERNVSTLHGLISKVARVVHLYAVENDSKDTTIQVLRSLHSKGLVHNIDSLVLDGLHSTKLCRRPIDSYNCPARVKRLAFLRQRAIDAVQKNGTEYDYVVMMDLDFVHLPEAEFIDLFTYMNANPHVDGVFGLSVVSSCTPCVYDVLAMMPWSICKVVLLSCHRHVKVTSAFSGVGVYRGASIRRRNPSYLSNGSRFTEHHTFNAHFDHLVVDTAFRPVYDGDHTFWYLRSLFHLRRAMLVVYAVLIICVLSRIPLHRARRR